MILQNWKTMDPVCKDAFVKRMALKKKEERIRLAEKKEERNRLAEKKEERKRLAEITNQMQATNGMRYTHPFARHSRKKCKKHPPSWEESIG